MHKCTKKKIKSFAVNRLSEANSDMATGAKCLAMYAAGLAIFVHRVQRFIPIHLNQTKEGGTFIPNEANEIGLTRIREKCTRFNR